MNARKFPRTMEEAYGPYHRSSQCPIEPMPEPMHPADWLVVKWGAISIVALVVILVWEWLA